MFLQGGGGQVGVSVLQASVHSDAPFLAVVGQQGGHGEFLLEGGIGVDCFPTVMSVTVSGKFSINHIIRLHVNQRFPLPVAEHVLCWKPYPNSSLQTALT